MCGCWHMASGLIIAVVYCSVHVLELIKLRLKGRFSVRSDPFNSSQPLPEPDSPLLSELPSDHWALCFLAAHLGRALPSASLSLVPRFIVERWPTSRSRQIRSENMSSVRFLSGGDCGKTVSWEESCIHGRIVNLRCCVTACTCGTVCADLVQRFMRAGIRWVNKWIRAAHVL